MADFIKVNKDLEKKYRKKYFLSTVLITFILFTVGILILYIYSITKILSLIVIGLLFIIFGVALFPLLLKKGKSKKDIIRSGIEGERAATSTLKNLPDSYTVLQNVKINFDGKISEIDNIIVGKTGIFIVEVKNNRGIIFGDSRENQWSQTKNGKGTASYTKNFYNPVKQVGTHIYKTSRFLRNNGIKKHICAAVYFVNPNATVRVINPREDIPVFQHTESDELIKYIENGIEHLSNAEIKKIISLLSR